MQKYFIFLFISILLSSCGDQASQSSAVAKSPASTQEAPKATKQSTPKGIQIGVSSVDAQRGEEACVSFTVRDFKNILAYQHSIQFDPIQLIYKGTKNYGLPDLSDSNFGATKAQAGSINFLWFDMNVKGVSLEDQAKVFDMCFEVKAKKGSACAIAIADKPIKMEVVGPQKQKLDLSTTPGVINVR